MSSSPASTSVVEQLLPFTGHYTLDGGSARFLLIDTNLQYQKSDGGVQMHHTASVTIHGDPDRTVGAAVDSSTIFDFESCGTFENGNLTVSHNNWKVVDVFLYRDYCNGNRSALIGNIAAEKVKGVTAFGAIQLPVFAATYYELAAGAPPEPRLKIDPDYSISYREGTGEYVQVTEYTYNYAMFVIQFTLNGEKYEFELGTTPGFGRVAGNAAKAGLLVSVPSFQVYPTPPAPTPPTPSTPPTPATTT
jgi:hypothetical protein